MPPFTVSSAAAHELLPACRLLFADGLAEHRRERLLSDSDTSGLFVARSGDGKLQAAALVQTLPGALGVAWAPRGDSAEAIGAVTAAACEWLHFRGVKVCQAFASAEEVPDMIGLERHGFRHTTQLVFMLHEVDRAEDRTQSRNRAEGEYYRAAIREEFVTTLLATHTDTLDCPELNGSRTNDELVAGFELPGVAPVSARHFLAKVEDTPIGVLVTNPGDGALELTYLGVVPSARRRGYGNQLVRRVLFDAVAMDFSTVTLSVDARNAPAMKLYARHGFVEYDRREVWLAAWPT
jgi:ribosomal protein S18 acetylase RimI-like enzyme